jgi:hypothetical protein
MKNFLISVLGIVLFSSCAPKITTTIQKSNPVTSFDEPIQIFNIQDEAPVNAEYLGSIRIFDSGFSTHCKWDVVIEKAKLEARKVGGNALKITRHIPPSIMGSSCDQIQANILWISDDSVCLPARVEDTLLKNADYALLHVYRPSGAGFLVGYDLYLGDSLLCRVKNNFSETIKIKKDGMNSLWARTESKKEIPINIKFGKEYYLRCGITMGFFVGHPFLELVDQGFGKSEFESLKH